MSKYKKASCTFCREEYHEEIRCDEIDVEIYIDSRKGSDIVEISAVSLLRNSEGITTGLSKDYRINYCPRCGRELPSEKC